ncbi:uncharacterized protein LOC102803603 isoform X2 [Saccoglossus kowalevskii]
MGNSGSNEGSGGKGGGGGGGGGGNTSGNERRPTIIGKVNNYQHGFTGNADVVHLDGDYSITESLYPF